MSSILLYSGGLDSELYRLLLPTDKLLFYDYGGKYSNIEKDEVTQLSFKEEIIVDETFNFSVMEKDNHIVPMRNIYFILKAFEYADTVRIGVTFYDFYRDQQKETLDNLEKFITEYFKGTDVPSSWDKDYPTLDISLSLRTKGELIEKCLQDNIDVSHLPSLRTCYSPTSVKGCGKCKSCVQKAMALAVNSMYEPNLFDFPPHTTTKGHIDKYFSIIEPIKELNEVFSRERDLLLYGKT